MEECDHSWYHKDWLLVRTVSGSDEEAFYIDETMYEVLKCSKCGLTCHDERLPGDEEGEVPDYDE